MCRRLIPWAWSLVSIALAGCPKQSAIWIAPHSTADSLVFVIGEQPGKEHPFRFYYLLVDHCGTGSIASRANPPTGWWILDTTARHPLASRISYGVTPAGYAGADSSPRLAAGCYVADIAGPGRMVFQVATDGSITPGGASQEATPIAAGRGASTRVRRY